MVATELEVANLALGMINLLPLASFADPTLQAAQMSRIFAESRDQVLREHAWNFAHRIDALDDDATIDAGPYGFVYAYELPSDCIRIHKVCSEGDFNTGHRYSILQVTVGLTTELRLFADIGDAYARYTIRTEDVTLWDPLFVRALAAYLAFQMSSMQGHPDLQNNMYNLYLAAIASARAIDAGEQQTQQSEIVNPYVSERE